MNQAKRRSSSAHVLWQATRPVLKKRWLVAAGIMVLTLAAAAIELVAPLILKDIIDNHVNRGIASGLAILAVGYLLTIFGSQLIGFGQSYLTAVVGQHILLRLRALMAEHLERLPIRYYDRTPVGDIISRTTADVDAINTLFSTGVVNAVTNLFKITGVLVAMFALSVPLAGLAVASVPVIYAVTELFRRHILGAQRQARRGLGRIAARMQETMNGMQTVHIFGLEQRMLTDFHQPQAEYLSAANEAAAWNAYFPGVLQAIQAAVLGLVLWIGSRPSLLAAGLTLGAIAAFTQLVSRLFSPVQSLSQQYQTIQQALAGVERVVELLNEPAEESIEQNGTPSIDAVPLTVEGLTFGHLADRPVLHNISFDIHRGEHVAVVGRTGAGKTSLISLISGLYSPWEGELRVFGVGPRTLRPKERRKLLGVVPQTTHVFEGTIRENITLGDPDITDEQVAHAVKMSRLDAMLARLPQGLDTQLGIEGTKLSHGEAQLLCLARALVYDPPLLLLDEPTSGMDVTTEELIFDALNLNRGSRTIIVVSHRLSGVTTSDRVIILARGRVVEDGPPEQLAARGGWFEIFRQLELAGWQVE